MEETNAMQQEVETETRVSDSTILLTDFIPAYVFDFLEESKVLVLTVEQRLAISERAWAYYTRFVSNQKTKGRIGIEITGFLGNTDPKLIVRILSKQFAVNDFFEQCKAEGKEIIFPGTKLLSEQRNSINEAL